MASGIQRDAGMIAEFKNNGRSHLHSIPVQEEVIRHPSTLKTTSPADARRLHWPF
jgi:hypothetical protein